MKFHKKLQFECKMKFHKKFFKLHFDLKSAIRTFESKRAI